MIKETAKVTLNEISAEIGISRTTLYKVINDKGFVSEKTRQKVQDALKSYGYVPNYNARELAKNKKYRIAYIGMRHLSAQYFSTLTGQGMARAYSQFVDSGLELTVRESDFDKPEEQLKNIDEMREKGVKSFVIAPSDVALLKPRIKALYDEGCDVIMLSRFVDIPGRTYVGVDYYKSGMLAGEMLTKIMPGGGRIAVANNSTVEADVTVRGRYEGFVSWINSRGGYEIAERVENVNTNENAKDAFDYICERYRDFEGLDAVYDITYKLNILAEKLSARSGKKKIRLVGFDVYPEIVEHVRSGAVDVVIGQQLSEQAYDAVKLLFNKMCHGENYLRKDYFSRLNVVVASNIDCFI